MIEYIAAAETRKHLFRYGDRDPSGRVIGTVTRLKDDEVVLTFHGPKVSPQEGIIRTLLAWVEETESGAPDD
jgi:hypothetical protein